MSEYIPAFPGCCGFGSVLTTQKKPAAFFHVCRMKELGYYGGEITGKYDDLSMQAFSDYCGVENYEERICEGDFFDEHVLKILMGEK